MSRFSGDVYFDGTLSARAMSIPPGTVDNTDIKANAKVDALKLQHQHRLKFNNSESATTVVSGSWPVHAVYGATAVLMNFRVGTVVANIGAATITVDLKKDGVSVLSAPITLNNTHAARQMVAGTIITTAGVAGDVYEITVVATAGGGTVGKGLIVDGVIHEDAQ